MRYRNHHLVIVGMVMIVASILIQIHAPTAPQIEEVSRAALDSEDDYGQRDTLWGISTAHAEPKRKKRAKRKRRKRYERARREVTKLIEAGHPTVQLTLKTTPRVRAVVYHGKEELGSTPLQLTWTKDTGPIDVTLRAKGYLKVNSRLYTHRNDHVTVQMFKEEESHLLFGYKKKVKSKSEDGSAGE